MPVGQLLVKMINPPLSKPHFLRFPMYCFIQTVIAQAVVIKIQNAEIGGYNIVLFRELKWFLGMVNAQIFHAIIAPILPGDRRSSGASLILSARSHSKSFSCICSTTSSTARKGKR